MFVTLLLLLGLPDFKMVLADTPDSKSAAGPLPLGRLDVDSLTRGLDFTVNTQRVDEGNVDEVADEIRKAARKTNLRLSSGLLLKQFSKDLDLEELLKVLLLQGPQEGLALLTAVGLKDEFLAPICQKPLFVSQSLIVAAKGELDTQHLKLLEFSTAQPIELKEDVARAIFRAIATGCAFRYVSNQRRRLNA